MKKAVIYCRVSSKRQVEEGHGNESQEKRCREYSLAKGYEVEKVFTEEAVSGKTLDRPSFDQLITYLDKHKHNKYVVVFDDLKRFARDIQVHFKLKSEIIGRGSTVESPNFNFEDTPEGHFIEQVIAAQAELERNQNQRQVLQKMKARLDMGYWPFCPPPALINKKDKVRGKVLHKREPYATIYKDAIEKYANDRLNTIEEVRRYIISKYKDYCVDDSLSLTGAFNILTEELYCGYIQYKPWDIPFKKAQHKGFIDLETYRRVQLKISKHSSIKPRKDYNPQFPLRGLVLCSECKRPLTGSRNKGRNKYYENYWCNNSKCNQHNKSIRNVRLHEDFEKVLRNVKPLDGIIRLVKRIIFDQWENRKKDVSDAMDSKKSKIGELSNRIRDATDLIIKTKNEDVRKLCESEISKFIKEKTMLENSLVTPPEFSQEKFGTATEKVLNVLSNPFLMWRSDDLEIKKILVYMYFETRPVYNRETGFGTIDLAYPIKLMRHLSDSQYARVEMSGVEPESIKAS